MLTQKFEAHFIWIPFWNWIAPALLSLLIERMLPPPGGREPSQSRGRQHRRVWMPVIKPTSTESRETACRNAFAAISHRTRPCSTATPRSAISLGDDEERPWSMAGVARYISYDRMIASKPFRPTLYFAHWPRGERDTKKNMGGYINVYRW